MNKQEAIEAMKAGSKVCHRSFMDHEWVTIKNGNIITEEGYERPMDEFWVFRDTEIWEDGWSIWKGSPELPIGTNSSKTNESDDLELLLPVIDKLVQCIFHNAGRGSIRPGKIRYSGPGNWEFGVIKLQELLNDNEIILGKLKAEATYDDEGFSRMFISKV